MSVHFSPVIAASERGKDPFRLKAVDLKQLGATNSPVTVLDDFRVRGRPFEPHPHAGFSAVTYVFEDSPGELRSRDSLGNDMIVGPGGIVWTQAGSGIVHHEVPAGSRELHGLQLFVNLSAQNKLIEPRMMLLQSSQIPVWRNANGDAVRVVVGTYDGVSSPLTPPEPFQFLEVHLNREVSVDLPAGDIALVYVVSGDIIVGDDGNQHRISESHALSIAGDGASVVFQSLQAAHFLILSGAPISDPMLARGPFIMNSKEQIEAAAARYQAGEMGYLAPLPDK
ncbi:pirin family protein [Mesorhizobium sp. B2-1-8]|uniref:pirin family protein n=1 Tax=Mesorhizobium sp. B2-1-8 TaxID=2589967 RepID=UPI00112A45B2|nr:pirin-like C-terminal cupin domain-containing protein [Mesorhizobium sp. B2-1-8]UCI19931.1 pirin family protein [Mesorhizobium sp. B2-1-8]